MSFSVAPRPTARMLAVLTLVVALLAAVAAPGWATEAEDTAVSPSEEAGPAPGIDEIGERNEIADQYRPEPAEAPPFMRFFYVPLILGGFVIAGMLLFMYLVWQPRFAEERRSKRRR